MRRYCQKKMGKIGAKRPEKRRKIERKPRKTSMWLLICVISTRKRRRKSITGQRAGRPQTYLPPGLRDSSSISKAHSLHIRKEKIIRQRLRKNFTNGVEKRKSSSRAKFMGSSSVKIRPITDMPPYLAFALPFSNTEQSAAIKKSNGVQEMFRGKASRNMKQKIYFVLLANCPLPSFLRLIYIFPKD